MNLAKAIEILSNLALPLKTAQDHDNHLAVRLGIEALKRITYQRKDHLSRYSELLPGETEE